MSNICPFPAHPSLAPPAAPAAAPTAPESTLQEMFAAPRDAAAIGLILSQLKQREGHAGVLWVQDRRSIRELGRVFLHGLPQAAGRDIVHVMAKDGREALWAMAEGLKCATLGAVIGEIHGDPRALDFTATRRLAVAAERYGVPAFLLRIGGNADLSGARRRWRVESRPSLSHPHDTKAPGAPVWSLDLFRARDAQPRQWEASYDGALTERTARYHTKDRLDLVPHSRDGSLDQSERRAG